MFRERKKKKESVESSQNKDEFLPLPKIETPGSSQPLPPLPTLIPPPPTIKDVPLPSDPKNPPEMPNVPSSSLPVSSTVPTLDPIVLEELESKLRSGSLKDGLTKVAPHAGPRHQEEKKPRQYQLTKVEPQTIPKKVSSFDEKLEKDIQGYIDTARKWEESGLLNNAAVSFACAALTSYSIHGPAEAAKMLATFAKSSKPDVVGHPAFQAAKALLVGVIKKDQQELLNAVKWLKKVTFQFPDDKEVFRMAISKTRDELNG